MGRSRANATDPVSSSKTPARGSLLDKFEGRIRSGTVTEFQTPIREFLDAATHGENVPGFTPTPNGLYLGRLDLRVPDVIDGMLHVQHRRNGDHKLELLDIGGIAGGYKPKSYTQIVGDVSCVIKGNPEAIETMRMDPCVDVPNVTMPFFKKHMRARFKRYSEERGIIPVIEYAEMGMAEPETGYLGRMNSGDFFRVYNKTHECIHRFHTVNRIKKLLPVKVLAEILPDLQGTGMAGLDGMKLPPLPFCELKKRFADRLESLDEIMDLSFEETFGFPETAIITRVERQMRSKSKWLPEIATLGALKEGLASFNPFEHLVIEIGSKDALPEIPTHWATDHPDKKLRGKKIGARDYLVIRGMQELVKELGMPFAYKELDRRSKGNAKLLLDKYAQFLPAETAADGQVVGITESQLVEMYHDSISRQMAA
jgi:hypothetical protein